MHIFIQILHIPLLVGPVGRVFANDPGDLGSIPGHVITKTLKLYLIPPCFTISNIRYVSRVKWSNTGKGVASSTTPGVVAIEEGAFWTMVANFILLYLHIL